MVTVAIGCGGGDVTRAGLGTLSSRHACGELHEVHSGPYATGSNNGIGSLL